MTNEQNNKKKKRLLKAAVVFILVAAACVIFVFWYAYYSDHSQAYKDCKKAIIREVSSQLRKDPNELTNENFEKVTEISLGLMEASSLRPFLKLKNLQQIKFIFVEGITANPDYSFLDFRPLAKLNKLREISFTCIFVSISGPPPTSKKKWYDGIISIIHKIKPPDPRKRLFDLGKLKNLNNLESLTIGYYKTENFEALANLKNLKHLNLRGANISEEQITELQKALPNLKIEK